MIKTETKALWREMAAKLQITLNALIDQIIRRSGERDLQLFMVSAIRLVLRYTCLMSMSWVQASIVFVHLFSFRCWALFWVNYQQTVWVWTACVLSVNFWTDVLSYTPFSLSIFLVCVSGPNQTQRLFIIAFRSIEFSAIFLCIAVAEVFRLWPRYEPCIMHKVFWTND